MVYNIPTVELLYQTQCKVSCCCLLIGFKFEFPLSQQFNRLIGQVGVDWKTVEDEEGVEFRTVLFVPLNFKQTVYTDILFDSRLRYFRDNLNNQMVQWVNF
uniref:Uncharacterized protein n=1 Tax=Cacopsylla melanoneura TaxID=428564 RepID=A0A8D8QYC2_9HEMI